MSNLNDKPLTSCYAFELRVIVENRREDGMRGSPQRQLEARKVLANRAARGDARAEAQLDILGSCHHGYPDQGEGCDACSRCAVCGGLNPGDVSHTRCGS